ncbi:Rieske 2Fe-2S domain-containing protein [Gordonia terrae]|uniref:Rieske-type oxygenase n=2 Tax=Gordonia terrae TaxID=2055 RepID=A0AAD0K7G4_9ACTN|nr:Rieske 2Fe-2S domain-containing protein [Gordonia terrae]VTR09598.1 3-ketosteroid-9-alpha-hydroxylase oxygenase subunit [Clostridioides difficile]ANY22209.1 3-ketosteroid-9-alpha-hydroxylase [Gordonia terrae]AWO82950.1 aromatic ring-hydroxylating dioxygenase subunit alpha [Gordonia terrae]VTS29738.1 3-ketosteroid-9-alpha-hydroxylase oxygenase subunit [Gordonia terrae]GAB46323.1 3-ketosteroid 9alpha-hydroxylase component KshA [Gordonia terrae NBRC 100016]
MATINDTNEEVRIIEAGTPPARYARGWHCLGLLTDFTDGQPHQITAFGTELVVFAGEDGKLNVLNAFCPHMGGNLAQGTVKGNTIACPFHDWRWQGNGKCADIPYARRVPPLARTKSWPTLESNGLLYVWNDPQNRKPPADITIPAVAGYGEDGWTDWVWRKTEVTGSHCRELVDNIVDMAHFFYVHYGMPTYFKNVFEGHVATQVMKSKPRADAADASIGSNYDQEGMSDASYFGPSFMIDKLWVNVPHDQESNVTLINCHYPVSADSFVLQYGVIVKKPEGLTDEEADGMAAMIAEGVAIGFEQDVKIWKNKSRIDNPLLSEEDGPVYQLRRWYEQFYVDVEDIDPEMTNRFEFEIDTERALKNWQAEVDANVAAGRNVLSTPGS